MAPAVRPDDRGHTPAPGDLDDIRPPIVVGYDGSSSAPQFCTDDPKIAALRRRMHDTRAR
jgi:hypothetical protein